jgi:hypothetical protein
VPAPAPAAFLAIGLASIASGWGAPAPAAAPARWAQPAAATIHPGVQLFTNGAQCTANFIFTDGARVFIGQAAACANASTPGGAEGDCSSPSLPLGTPVTIAGATRSGRLVYSSWISMQLGHEKDPNACAYNDLALVEVDAADAGSVNPSIPAWGGPTGVNTTGTAFRDDVYAYGNSELALGVGALGPRKGLSLGDTGAGWSHRLVTLVPGMPGDPGSAVLDGHGRALGVLSTVDVTPVPGSNGVGDLARELGYLRSHSRFKGLQLAMGTQPFTGSH